MRRSRKFCQKGSNFELFFLRGERIFIFEGREDPNKYRYKGAIIDPPAKRFLNGVLLAGR